MTDGALTAQKRRPARRVGLLAGAWTALVLFLAVLALLATRMAAGQDPGVLARTAAAQRPPRRILVRRVLERRVIIHLPPTAELHATQSAEERVGRSPAFPPITRTS